MKNRSLLPLLSFAVLFGLGGLVYAAGAGAPARGIPYRGFLEVDGNPVSAADVAMTFRLFDGDTGTSEAQLYSADYTVDVASGDFTVVLGREGPALGDAIFAAAELWLEIDVDGTTLPGRQQLWALPQAVRAGQANSLNVTNGMLFNGTPHTNAGTDLGLYSSTPNKYIRAVTNGGRFNVYSDGATSDGYGGVPNLEVTATGTTVRPDLNVTGTATTGDLLVNGRFLGQPTTITIASTAFTASVDGLYTVSVEAVGDGARGHGEIIVNNSRAAVYSVHYYPTSDNQVRWATGAAGIRRGDDVVITWTTTSGADADFVFVQRFVPFGASL